MSTDTAPVVFATPATRIGRHEWRLVILAAGAFTPEIRYQWRALELPDAAWQADWEWPGANRHDQTLSWLPKRLAANVFSRYRQEFLDAYREVSHRARASRERELPVDNRGAERAAVGPRTIVVPA
jgi:hypothetical protein